jgi:hypothetical protein
MTGGQDASNSQQRCSAPAMTGGQDASNSPGHDVQDASNGSKATVSRNVFSTCVGSET